MIELTPEAEKMTFALLGLVEVLALVVVTVKVPFPVPEAADKLSQEALSDTVQLVFETTLMLPVEPDVEATGTLDGVADKVGIISSVDFSNF